jgi:hypothetical protein
VKNANLLFQQEAHLQVCHALEAVAAWSFASFGCEKNFEVMLGSHSNCS